MNQQDLRDLENQHVQECAPTCPANIDVRAMLVENGFDLPGVDDE